METRIYLKVLEREEGRNYSSFNLYLPAGGREIYTEYRFRYDINPVKPELHYGIGPNDPANREFYRINKAYIVRKDGENFVPLFRALSGGEIGLAIREEGAGDFVGGVHGDERLSEVRLTANGREMPLDRPFFGEITSFSFYERSTIYRCNTPENKLMIHTQSYGVDGDKLTLSQNVLWTSDGKRIQSAFMPMLTAQRFCVEDKCTVLSDTVEFYAPDGRLLECFDTSPYGLDGEHEGGEPWVMRCNDTPATSVRVYGKESGFSADVGYVVRDNSIPGSQIRTSLCIRFSNALDNKIYFDIAKGTQPKQGTEWKSDVFYRIRYTK